MSYCMGGIIIEDGETFLEACVRQIPERERVLSGLALKIVSLRLSEAPKEEEQKYIAEYDKINAMNNKEYERRRNG